MRRTVQIAGGIESLFGTLDENLKLFESALRVTTHLQDDKLAIDGEPAQVERAVRILDEYNELVHEGRVLDNGAVKALLRVVTEEPNISLRGILQPGRPRAFGKKSITPKSANQRRYMEFIERYDMVFAIGPGGTGKTYLAVAMAVSSLLTKQVNRIILARPAVEAGERLGFLPGTLQQKIDPYMRPLYDALCDLNDALLQVALELVRVQHVVERVVKRAHVGVDLLLQRPRQKPQPLACLDRRSRQNDAIHLLGQQRRHGHGHGQVRLARAAGTDGEDHVVPLDEFHVAALVRALGRDGFLAEGAGPAWLKNAPQGNVRLFRDHAQ